MSTPGQFVEDSSPSGEFRRLGITEPYAEWLARRQLRRGRQPAISRNLSTLVNYKTWAEQVSGDWEPGEGDPQDRRRPGGKPR